MVLLVDGARTFAADAAGNHLLALMGVEDLAGERGAGAGRVTTGFGAGLGSAALVVAFGPLILAGGLGTDAFAAGGRCTGFLAF